jgi:hypothetical protein
MGPGHKAQDDVAFVARSGLAQAVLKHAAGTLAFIAGVRASTCNVRADAP